MEVVNTTFGPITGVVDGGSLSWLGLRYATAERWGLPAMVAPWEGVLPATSFGASCPQQPNVESSARQSEDCLFVNIWMPSGAERPPNRVLAFLHGGSFEVGSIAPMYNGSFLYSGAQLAAEQNVTVATIQYRLGALGWLARANATNLGLRDQRVALRFLRRCGV